MHHPPRSARIAGVVIAGLLASACAATGSTPATTDLAGTRWLAEDIDARGVMDGAQSTLSFDGDGRVAGSGGCNRYFGQAQRDGSRLRLGPLGSTMMACPEAVMDQERRFLAALEASEAWRIDTTTGLLYLSDADGRDILRFSPLAD